MIATTLSLLPLYVLGNLHCMGMCGPLVIFLGRHRYRNCYFIGRLSSFTFAGVCAGGAGGVVQALLLRFYIPCVVSLIFGSLLALAGVWRLAAIPFPLSLSIPSSLASLNRYASLLLLKDHPAAVFLFGFLTILLPCGQTIVVYSALALEGSAMSGFVNGLLFGLLTSPALFLAMRAQTLFRHVRMPWQQIYGASFLLAGIATILRGLAEAGVIEHAAFTPFHHYPFIHIVLY